MLFNADCVSLFLRKLRPTNDCVLFVIFVKLAGTQLSIMSIISQLSQEMAAVLHVHSACFAVACLGHLCSA